MDIKRVSGSAAGRSQATAYAGLVWAVGAAWDPSQGLADQTRQALQVIDRCLAELGTDRTRLLSAQVFLTDMRHKPEMDTVWNKWIGPDPGHWPQRACLGTALTGDLLVEITVVAAGR